MEEFELHECGLLMRPERILREERRALYEGDKNHSNTVRWWEYDGYGYKVSHPVKSRTWYLRRTDLTKYHNVVHSFRSDTELMEYVQRRGWRDRIDAGQLEMEFEVTESVDTP